jgi:rhamnulokinase
MSADRYLAFDLGAESGRAVVGTLADGRLSLEEVHRFPNHPVAVCDTLYWDVLSLYSNVLQGMREHVRRFGDEVAGIGIDTWALDFGLLDGNGALLGNPVCYRDRRTEGMLERAFARMPAAELYERTGLYSLPIHTLFQLLSLRFASSPVLDAAARFLMMPGLLGYFLTGASCCERTNAITTQLYDPRARTWSREVFETFELPLSIMPELVDPGTVVGSLRDAVAERTGLAPVPVMAVCNHDTGSAVAAVPGEGEDWAFISSGTWSVVGILIDEVVASDAARAARVCNELTLGSLFLCRNIMGLWLLQKAREAWGKAGREHSYEEIVARAGEAPEGGPVVDPDDLCFLAPPDMPRAIADYCRRTGQTPPEGVGPVARCILESLALSYREAVECLAALAGRPVNVVHIVGGGSRNGLLCQLTADATGLPVLAGPVEATVAGNVLVQALARGALASPAEVRAVVRRSTDLAEYRPRHGEAWDERYATYRSLADL